MTKDKHYNIQHIIYSINNIKEILLFIQWKKIYLPNDTSCLLNNMKTYIISKKIELKI
jgi:hypothetical protein